MAKTINIQIIGNESEELRKIYSAQQDKVKKDIDKLKFKLKIIEDNLKAIENSKNGKNNGTPALNFIDDISTNNYNEKWSVFQKVQFFLQLTGKPLSSNQILNLLLSQEKNISDSDKKLLKNNLSATLTQKIKNSKILIRTKSEDYKGYLYGLLEWNKK